MKKLVALLLIWAIAIVANCSEKDFAFFYSFNKKTNPSDYASGLAFLLFNY